MNEEIERRLSSALSPSHCEIALDGNRAQVLVIADAFEGMNRVKRQQAVYACLNDFIADGSLHAVSIVAKTPAEWQAAG